MGDALDGAARAKVWAIRGAIFGLLGLIGLSTAQAQEGKRPWEEYDQLIQKNTAITALGPTLFGDAVDLASGSLSFSATDVSLPGNNGLPVAFSRKLVVQDKKGYLKVVNGVNRIVHDNTLADWELDAPRIEGTFAQGWTSACAASTVQEGMPPTIRVVDHWFEARDYWHGNTLVIPGGGGGEMLVATNPATARPTTGGPYYWVTADFTYFSCLPAGQNFTGQAFQAVTADGTRYWFDWASQTYAPDIKNSQSGAGEASLSRRKVAVYATRVEDRHGNWVTYTYANASNAPARLTAIAASDGRAISVTYNAQGHVQTVTANGRVWTYAYAYPSADTGTLVSVTLPDGSAWTYALSALSDARFRYFKPAANSGESYRDCLNPGDVFDTGPIVGTVTHPSGAVGQFTVAPTRFGRSNVPMICGGYSTPQNDTNDDVSFYPVAWDSFALTRKQVSGPGLTAAEWNYQYDAATWFAPGTGPTCTTPGGCAAPVCASDSCAGTSVTTVLGPENTFMRHTFGNSYRYNEGKLLTVQQGSNQPRVILKTTATDYQLAQSGQPYPTPIGTSPQQRGSGFVAEYLRPEVASIVTQQDTDFIRVVAKGCQGAGIYCFDAYARPTKMLKTSAPAQTAELIAPRGRPALTVPATSATGSYPVAWTTVAYASRYELQERAGAAAWSTIHDAAGTSVALSGKQNGGWSYQVRACNAQGCGPWSAIASIEVMVPPANPPAVSAPASSTSGSYTVTWSSVALATTYALDEAKDGGAWTTIHNGSGNSVARSSLPDGAYQYRARACNAGGCSGYSTPVTTTVTLPAPQPPGAPATLTVPSSASTGSTFTVSWSAVVGATSYELYRNRSQQGWTSEYVGGATSKTQNLNFAAVYQYRARACNANGCGAYSPVGAIEVENGTNAVSPVAPTE